MCLNGRCLEKLRTTKKHPHSYSLRTQSVKKKREKNCTHSEHAALANIVIDDEYSNIPRHVCALTLPSQFSHSRVSNVISLLISFAKLVAIQRFYKSQHSFHNAKYGNHKSSLFSSFFPLMFLSVLLTISDNIIDVPFSYGRCHESLI